MHLIDDVDFMRARGGEELDRVAEFANIVDTSVRSSINFDDIERTTLCDLMAMFTGIAGLRSFSVATIDGLGEEASECCFAGATWTSEEIGLANSTKLESIFECTNH